MTSTQAPGAGTLISSTLPYVNAEPHVGFALELCQTDAVARTLRLFAEPLQSITGSDEHSLKNVQSARAKGLPLGEHIARNAAAFERLSAGLGVQFDHNVATSRDPRHRACVERLFAACAARGDLYRRSYTGHYCVGCEAFYDVAELRDGVCPEHLVPPESVAEENWFFRLSRYEERLRALIQSDELCVLPRERKNEVLAFLDGGLTDISVSRSAARAQSFGIPVPADPSQVVYVWFDALASYLTAGDYGQLGSSCAWQQSERRIHVLGKGVLRFHAVYWPAFLLSAGLKLPTELRVHGYLTVEGRKIGKSLGNALDPAALLGQCGANALRYYLLRHVPPFKDADFSRERLLEAHDGELADELGNLLRRVLTLLHRSAGGRVPEAGPLGAEEQRLAALAVELPARARVEVERHELAAALGEVFRVVRETNRYLELSAPWKLAQPAASELDRRRLHTILTSALSALRCVAVGLWPFVPELASDLARAVGLELASLRVRHGERAWELPRGLQLEPARLLAPRLVPRSGARVGAPER
ncbi:MAG TPA: methionine--tRNA ligase [Polyangiaceae bacterium]|nr:methionine--tRNA ligase [Polyangiaceae bacterium]